MKLFSLANFPVDGKTVLLRADFNVPMEQGKVKDIRETIQKEKTQTIFVLENLRFYKEEEQNDSFFAHSLANLAEVYVNDAFGVSHRKHASVDAITQFLPSMTGLLFEKELQELSKGLFPEKPAVLLLGGAKLNKVGLVEQALRKFDHLLIGGAL